VQRIARAGLALGSAVLLSILLSGIASAHVVKTFGTYSVALGWVHEPTYVGEENAVQAVVKDAKGAPVTDLKAGDLKVTVSLAGQSTDALDLVPTLDPDTGLGTPGDYEASIIPTAVGDYTFHLTGSIHGTAVDETATSSDSTFESVTDPGPIQFPTKLPAIGDLNTLITRVDGRTTTAATAASDAQDRANLALDVGVVVGGIGIVLGLAGIAMARRRPTSTVRG
jgi:hypothetical protein